MSLIRQKSLRSLAANNYLWRSYEEILRELRRVALEAVEECPFRTRDELHAAAVLVGRLSATSRSPSRAGC